MLMATVLVVEDSRPNAQLIKAALETRGFEVMCAFDGDEGVRLAHELRPALIVMDLRLPGRGVDGWEAIELIRSDPIIGQVPIIVTSVESHPSDRQRAFDVGCDVYLAKPFDINEFRGLVADFVGQP